MYVLVNGRWIPKEQDNLPKPASVSNLPCSSTRRNGLASAWKCLAKIYVVYVVPARSAHRPGMSSRCSELSRSVVADVGDDETTLLGVALSCKLFSFELVPVDDKGTRYARSIFGGTHMHCSHKISTSISRFQLFQQKDCKQMLNTCPQFKERSGQSRRLEHAL